MDRTACFIDGGYLQNVLKYFAEPRIDFSKLNERMKGAKQLLRTYYYNCKCLTSENPTDEEIRRRDKQQKFFYSLQRIPQFECKFGTLERRPNGEGYTLIQKQVDVMMALDIATLSLKHLITEAKIISGDADLIPAIQIAKNEGVVVELFYSPGTAGHELLQIVDSATEINYDWLEKILMEEENFSC